MIHCLTHSFPTRTLSALLRYSLLQRSTTFCNLLQSRPGRARQGRASTGGLSARRERRTARVARQKGRECDEGFDSSVQGDVDDRFGKRCADVRSEEHTSELQSLMRISYAVFCLTQ